MPTPFARTFSRLLVLCLMALGVCRAVEKQGAVIRSVGELQSVRLAEGDQSHRVEITAVVLRLASPKNPDRFTAQDDTAGMSVNCARRPDGSFAYFPPTVQVGMRVRIQGIATRGPFTNFVQLDDPPRIEVLGKGEWPACRTLTREDILSGAYPCMRAQVEGVLRSVSRGEAEVLVHGQRVFCSGRTMSLLEGKVGGRIRMSGICYPFYNSAGQALGVRLSSVVDHYIPVEMHDPLEIVVPPVPAASLSLCTSRELFSMHIKTPIDERVRVRGTVLFHQPGKSIYIRDVDGGLRVDCKVTERFQPGDSIEVLGFPAQGEVSPFVEDATVTRLSSGAPPQPLHLHGAELMEATHDADLVNMEAQIIDASVGPGGLTLLLRQEAGMPAIMATLGTLPPGAKLDAIKPGAVVRVSGILGLTAGKGFVSLGIRAAANATILLRSLDDVTITSRAPWWTTRRILTVLACVVALALTASVWGMALRRRVEVQTEIIRDKVQRESVHEDRLRIARELHDTLAQELLGLGRQAQAVAQYVETDPGRVRGEVEQLQELIRISQHDARNAVWDLRDEALLSGDLATALRAVVSRVILGTEAQVDVHVAPDVPVPLPHAIESNLLRVAQEAVANAAGHGQASQVHIRIGMQDGKLHIGIEDNGRGFDTTKLRAARAGSFGIFGMRERIEKLVGKFDIESTPGRGTTIRAIVPLAVKPSDISLP